VKFRDRILQALSQRDIPCDVEKIRVAVGAGNWNTALHHLLELLIDEKICGQKTSRGWIFWKKQADAT